MKKVPGDFWVGHQPSLDNYERTIPSFEANRMPSYENAVNELGATRELKGGHLSAAIRRAIFLASTACASAMSGAERMRSSFLRFTKRPFLAPAAATRADCPKRLHRLEREIMLFIGKPMGRSIMISNAQPSKAA